MNCEEMRTGAMKLDQISIGEAASLTKHYKNCPSCQQWLIDQKRKFGVVDYDHSCEAAQKGREFAERCLKDPEFVEIVHGTQGEPPNDMRRIPGND